MNRPWTKSELEILLSARDKRRIKVANRSKKSIRRKLISMGLVKPAFRVQFLPKKVWTQNEITLLKTSTDPRKAKIPGRSRQSIGRMAVRLKLIKKEPARIPWKRKEEKLLVQLAQEGKTPIQIFRMGVLSKSRNSIQKKLSSLGLCQKAPKIDKFSETDLSKFKNFLKENWQNKTPQQLADQWNNQNDFKIKRSKVIYHLAALDIKIPQAEILITNNLKETEEKIKQAGATSAKKLEESLRFARADVMRERILKNRDIWTGLPLKEQAI